MGMTPLESSVGGILIGTSVAAMFALHGRVAGISGCFKGTLQFCFGKSCYNHNTHELYWRLAFIIGLIVSFPLHSILFPSSFDTSNLPDTKTAAISGLLVGVGTALANGCTSGHMICGMARLSKRSIISTLIFCSVAFVIVNLQTQPIESPHVKPIQNTFAITSQLISYAVVIGAIWFAYTALYISRKIVSSLIVYLLNGLVFGLGLIISGMADPAKVKGFFNLSHWDGSLMFVAMFAIFPNLLLYNAIVKKNIERKGKPVFEDIYHIPTSTDITATLIIGSLLFGMGWGVGGICPGPAIVSVGTFSYSIIAWVLSFLVGQAIAVFVS